MVELQQHSSLASALAEALCRHADRICLIEANRDRENGRLTYRDFAAAAAPVAATLRARGLKPGDRAAIIMTNQSKWLIAAYAALRCGATLVPLDYKLTPAELSALLEHSQAAVLITEHPIWRALSAAGGGGMPAAALKEENTAKPADPTRRRAGLHTVLVTEAPAGTDLGSALRWEACPPAAEEVSVQRRREDVACIVYSSGTGGRPKGCMLTHHSYLEQAASLMKLYTFAPGDCYLSILPTNHAIDFMVGFIGPFLCGATVVHLRTLRPEYIREALPRYLISYMAVVPMVLKSLQAALQQRFDALPPLRRRCLGLFIAVHRGLTRRRPRPWLARRLFPQIHAAFGGRLKALFVGGAFSEPQMLHFFNDVGIPVVNGYGLTEAGTALTLGRLRPFRPDTVGKPLPGVDIRIDQPDADGVGEVLARSPALMTGYLDDPELTAATIVGGWLHTGDSGRLDSDGHLQLVGRKRNMIVTPGGKNIYPEDVEGAFSGLPVRELCVFAADYIWPRRGLAGEQLVAVLHVDSAGERVPPDLLQELSARNNRLLDFKRVSGCVVWNRDFPRTASMKIRRDELARAIGQARSREEAVTPL